jgi:hypothetical protein
MHATRTACASAPPFCIPGNLCSCALVRAPGWLPGALTKLGDSLLTFRGFALGLRGSVPDVVALVEVT